MPFPQVGAGGDFTGGTARSTFVTGELFDIQVGDLICASLGWESDQDATVEIADADGQNAITMKPAHGYSTYAWQQAGWTRATVAKTGTTFVATVINGPIAYAMLQVVVFRPTTGTVVEEDYQPNEDISSVSTITTGQVSTLGGDVLVVASAKHYVGNVTFSNPLIAGVPATLAWYEGHEGTFCEAAIWHKALTDATADFVGQISDGTNGRSASDIFVFKLEAGGGTTPVLASRTLQWSVLAAIDANRSMRWGLLSAVAASREARWSLLNVIEAGRSIQWGTLASVLASRSAQWSVLNAVSAQRRLDWALLQEIEASRSIQWGTLSALTPVLASLSMQWSLLQAVQAGRRIDWGLLAQIEGSRSLQWSLRQAVQASRRMDWSMLNGIQASRDVRWSLVSGVEASRSLQWSLQSDIEVVPSLIIMIPPDVGIIQVPGDVGTIFVPGDISVINF